MQTFKEIINLARVREEKATFFSDIMNLFTSHHQDPYGPTVIKSHFLCTSYRFLGDIDSVMEILSDVLLKIPIFNASLQMVEEVIGNCPGLHKAARRHAQAGDSMLEALGSMGRATRGRLGAVDEEGLRFAREYGTFVEPRLLNVAQILQEVRSAVLDLRDSVKSSRQINLDAHALGLEVHRLVDRMIELEPNGSLPQMFLRKLRRIESEDDDDEMEEEEVEGIIRGRQEL